MELPSLTITPDKTLEFDARQSPQSQVTLRLENPHDRNVAFKIKTTAPKYYLVKPSTGVILPKENQAVNILLIPQFSDRTINSDRFLVQSCFTDVSTPVTRDAWSAIPKNRIDERKLGVVVNRAPLGQSPGTGGADGAVPAAGATANAAGNSSHLLAMNTVATISSKPVPADYDNLRAHFDELLAVAVSLERQVKELAMTADRSMSSADKKSIASSNIEFWHVGIILIATIVGLKMFHYL